MSDHKNTYGFTLIEILIVIVIITISVNFAILAFGDFGEKTKITHSAENFSALISLIKKEAILTDQTMAIRIKKNSYDILKLNNNAWQTTTNGIYKKKILPNNVILFLVNQKHNSKNNFIIISASGKITPFTLNFIKNQNNKIILTITSDSFGNIKINEK